mmetsp:Transcript_3627/g.7476  ORF Transcript_3627/g.7476 Transcript_3627/m.7476 type:complete len:150 (-) Transcript_3627:207-656(-)
MSIHPDQLREAFANFSDFHLPPGQGTISTKDLGTLVRALGKNPKQEDLLKICNQIDPAGEGNITFEQFVQVMSMNLPPPEAAQELMTSFQAFDKDRSGLIAEKDLAVVMRTFGEPLTDEEVDLYMQAAEPFKQGDQINYKAFANFLSKA